MAVPQSPDPPPPVVHLFVYGTLAPGDVRWPILAPFAEDGGVPDSTDGQLYDTGLGYPAAMFGGDGTILGRTFRLHMETLGEALAALDAEESSVAGGYHRIEIDTHRGYRACAYQYGHGLRLTPITTGRWSDRRTEIGWALTLIVQLTARSAGPPANSP